MVETVLAGRLLRRDSARIQPESHRALAAVGHESTVAYSPFVRLSSETCGLEVFNIDQIFWEAVFNVRRKRHSFLYGMNMNDEEGLTIKA
jgi:hypothetical protein